VWRRAWVEEGLGVLPIPGPRRLVPGLLLLFKMVVEAGESVAVVPVLV
jgi:hypothetical protein